MNRQCILIFFVDTVIEVFLTLIAFHSNQHVSWAAVMLVTMHLKPGRLKH